VPPWVRGVRPRSTPRSSSPWPASCRPLVFTRASSVFTRRFLRVTVEPFVLRCSPRRSARYSLGERRPLCGHQGPWTGSRRSSDKALPASSPTPHLKAEARAARAKSVHQIAAALNGRGIDTARGGKWETRRWRTSLSARPLSRWQGRNDRAADPRKGAGAHRRPMLAKKVIGPEGHRTGHEGVAGVLRASGA
jgi:hypothetical protein